MLVDTKRIAKKYQLFICTDLMIMPNVQKVPIVLLFHIFKIIILLSEIKTIYQIALLFIAGDLFPIKASGFN